MARDQNLSLLSPSAGSGSLGLDVFSSGAPAVEPRRATAPRATASTGGGLDDSLVSGVADSEGLSPTQRRVMTALLQQESGYGRNPRTSVDGARGVGQIMPDTFRRYAKPGEEIGNTEHNLAVMARIVKDLGTKTGDNPAKMATGYFSGEGNIGRDRPWKNDAADGNGKRVSSYVSDVLGRLTGIPEAQAAPAERPQGAQPAKAEPQRDLSKAPAWADIAKNPEFQKLSPDQRRDAKGAYFDYWIAPNGGDDSLREQFMGMADPEPPGMLEKIKDAIPGKDQLIEGAKRAGDFALHMTDPTGIVRKGIEAISGRKPLMQDGTTVPERAGVDASRAPVKPEVRAAIERAYDAATPEQRIKLGQQEGFVGQIATELNQRYGLIDQEREQRSVPGMRSVVDDFDTRAEKRAERLVVRGDLDPGVAQERGRTGAAFGMTPGTEVAGNVEATEFDFDTNQLFKAQGLDNPLVRGIAKGGLGLLKGSAGVGEAMADFAFGPSKASGKVSQWARNKEEAIGQSGDFLSRNLEGAIASLGQQLPLLIAGAATGGSAITLAGMAMNSFGQEYTDGKSRGLDPTNAASRAALFAAFEVIGESFGLGGLIKQIGLAGKGIADPGELAKFFASNLKKEIPGELLTTTGQFLTDKVPAFGLNQQAGLEDYLKQVGDTVAQTVLQGGIMAGGTTGVNRAAQFLRQGDTTSDEAQFANALDRQVASGGWASSAEQAGLDAFARNVPGRELNVGAPPAPQAPTGLSVDGRLEPDTPPSAQPPVSEADPTAGTPAVNQPTPNQIQQSVDSIVGELAQRAGVPLETVLPVGTNAEDPTDTAEIQKQILALEANNPPPTIAPDGTLEYANEAPQGTGPASGADAAGEAGIAGGPAAQPQPAADAAGAEAGTEGDGQQAGTQPDAPVTHPAGAGDLGSMFDELIDEEDPAPPKPKTEKEAKELRNGTQTTQAQQAEAQGPQAQPGAVEPVAPPVTRNTISQELQALVSSGAMTNEQAKEEYQARRTKYLAENADRIADEAIKRTTPEKIQRLGLVKTAQAGDLYQPAALLLADDTSGLSPELDPGVQQKIADRLKGLAPKTEKEAREQRAQQLNTSAGPVQNPAENEQVTNAPQREQVAGEAPPAQGPQAGGAPAGAEAQAGGAPATGEPGVAPAKVHWTFISGNIRVKPEIRQVADAQLAAGNFKSVQTKTAGEVRLVAMESEGEIRVSAFSSDGGLVGDLVAVKGEPHNPGVDVEEGFRRQGIATEMYKLAESLGATIPPASDTGQVRTDDGRAFRAALAERGLFGKPGDGQIYADANEDRPKKPKTEKEAREQRVADGASPAASQPAAGDLAGRLKAVTDAYRDEGLEDMAKIVEISPAAKSPTEQTVAFQEDLLRRTVTRKKVIEGAGKGTLPPVEPRRRTMADIVQTANEDRAHRLVPQAITDAVMAKVNGIVDDLAARGLHIDEIDTGFPSELKALKDKESGIRGAFGRYAKQLMSVEKGYKNAKPDRFLKEETALAEELGIPLAELRQMAGVTGPEKGVANAGTPGEVASTDVRDGGDQPAGDARDPRGDREGADGDVGAAAGASAPGRGPDRTVQGAKSERDAALGTSPRKFFSDLIQAGGVSMRLIKDITGESGGKGSKGRGNILVPKLGPLFRNNGLELDELARRMAELGYLTEADIESEFDNGGVNKLTEMIQAAIRGEPITKVFDETGQTESRFEKMARDQAEGEVRAEAERLGIDTKGKSLEQLSDEIEDARDAAANTEAALAALRSLEERADQFGVPEEEFDAEKLVARAANINPDAVEAAAIRYDDDADFLRAIQEIVDEDQGSGQADRGREGGRAGSAQEAGQQEGGGQGARGGTQEEGGLTQQTPEELRRLDEERKRREAEQKARDLAADRKAEADAQRDTFELTGQGIQPGQGDMFGNSPSSGLFGEQTATPAADSSADQVAEVSLDGERILTPTNDQVDDVADTIENLARGDGDFKVTHVFDPPTKGDKVNLYEKAKVSKPKGGDWVKLNGEWMTPEQAKAELRKWKDNAAKQGNTGANANKVVLSLFDRTGVWAQPWADAGYQVFTFDIQNDPEFGDVTKFDTQFFVDTFNAFDGNDVYAILAACPCTDFTSAGNRWLAEKEGSEQMEASINLVKQTLATIEYFKPSVWAIENPVGTIERRTGLMPWRSAWDPFLFGDEYTKKTLLWGRFNGDMPVAPVFPSEGSKMWAQYGGKSLKTKNARSETPEGFAYAFFQANNAIDHPVMAIANKYERLDRGVIEQAVNAGLTEREISSAVDDAYYLDLDDAAAEQALRDLIAERPAPAPEGPNADSMFDELFEEEAPAADQAPATEPPVETTQPKTEKQARERRTQPAPRTRPDFSGKSVTLDVLVEDTGDTAKMTVPDAEEYFRRLEERESILRALVECLTK